MAKNDIDLTEHAESTKRHNDLVEEYSKLKDGDPRKKEIEEVFEEEEKIREDLKK